MLLQAGGKLSTENQPAVCPQGSGSLQTVNCGEHSRLTWGSLQKSEIPELPGSMHCAPRDGLLWAVFFSVSAS